MEKLGNKRITKEMAPTINNILRNHDLYIGDTNE
jgi:hypothetical protein